MARQIAVLGCGSWGLVLADLLASKDFDLAVWCHNQQLADYLAGNKAHPDFLKGIRLNPKITYTAELTQAAANKEALVIAVASPFYRGLCRGLKPLLAKSASADQPRIVISGVKGLEEETGKRMSQVLSEELPEMSQRLASLSGPNLALEIAQRQPAATVAAAADENIARLAQELFFTDYFRVYTSRDVVGVELGGTLKNIVALAAGAIDGLGLGSNTKSALVTRGLAEITRLGTKLGADPLTFMGLSGIGDLITTCFSPLSRNHAVGYRLARGEKLADILKDLKAVAEGIKTSQAAVKLGRACQVPLPIAEQVRAVVYEGKDIRLAIKDLLARSPKEEIY